jgi:ABC-type transport system involved in multi-copper enzyme maturation permease subunit
VIGEVFARLDRAQKQRSFKIIASIIILVLAVGGYAAAWVASNAPEAPERLTVRQAELAQDPASSELLSIGTTLLLSLTTTDGAVAFGLGTLVAIGAVMLVIWLGLSLSYLAMLLLGWGIGVPLLLFAGGFWGGIGELLVGIVPLALIFLTLIEALRLVLSGPNPVLAVARNVINEAVRMRISIVFIIILLLLLAVIPTVLQEDQPLRYRVQQWLQYGTGFSYGILALLTAFLSVGTVVFEQRDRIIWQTATKPVPAWQYLLGKWVGVMALNFVLLGVTAGGVYIFTEYLRHQPANGEIAYRVNERGQSTRGPAGAPPSTDRRLLERQVLVARVGTEALPGYPTETNIEYRIDAIISRMDNPEEADRNEIRASIYESWSEQLDRIVEQRVSEAQELSPDFVDTFQRRTLLRAEALDEYEQQYRSLDRNEQEQFVFDLSRARSVWQGEREAIMSRVDGEIDDLIDQGAAAEADRDRLRNEIILRLMDAGQLPEIPELTLRFQIEAGTNDPSVIYRFYMFINGRPLRGVDDFNRPRPVEVALGAAQTLEFPIDWIPPNGMTVLTVRSDMTNERTATFPPDGLEVLYPIGGYEANFFRVMFVMWVKLGFIAAVGIAVSTFLSFPVACLMVLGILFMAESAGFLWNALEYYSAKDQQGNVNPFAVLVRLVAIPISWTFRTYAELRPTAHLVDGRLLSWSSVTTALAILGAWTIGVLGIGLAIFRRRELAMYSGN